MLVHALTVASMDDVRRRRVRMARTVLADLCTMRGLDTEYHETSEYVDRNEPSDDGFFTVLAGEGWASFDALTGRGDFGDRLTSGLREFAAEVERRLTDTSDEDE